MRGLLTVALGAGVAFCFGCGGKVGDGTPPSPTTTTPTSLPFTEPPSRPSGGGSARRVTCKPGEATLGTFPNERALRVVVSLETGVVATSTRDASGSVRVRVLRDPAKGLEDLGTFPKSSGALAASPTHVAFANDTAAVTVSVADGSKKSLAQGDGSPAFLGLRESEVVAVRGAKVSRHPFDGGPASQVCLGSTCTVAGVASFDSRAGTMALVDTEGALYTGTDVGLRKVATGAKGSIAVGAGFVSFVMSASGAPEKPSLAIFRPLEEDVELFALPTSNGLGCGPSAVEVLALASDGARLAFATKESYPCAESPQALAFASRASRLDAAAELPGAKNAVTVATDDTCVYALVERAQGGNTLATMLVSIENRAR